MASPKRKRPAVVRIAGEKRVANDREKKFAREYLKCFNFYKAAKAAGFAETTARRTAYMIFSRPWVQEYVEELRAKYELDDIAEVKEVIRSYTDLYTLRDEMAEDPNFIEKNKADLCASLQTTIVEILLDKLVKASKEYGIRDIAIAGGVSANSGLRNGITEEGRKRGWRTFLPEFKFTTDNAAMIALAGYYRYMNGNIATLDIAPVARLEELELTVAPTAEQ